MKRVTREQLREFGLELKEDEVSPNGRAPKAAGRL